jgi:hypothetical protein
VHPAARAVRGAPFAVLGGAVLVVVGLLLAIRPVGDQRERHQLTRGAVGTVVSVQAIDDVYTRLTVTWSDPRKGPHRAVFDTDTDEWATGEEFDVRYDPAHLSLVRPADAYYTNDGALRATALAQGGAVAASGLLLVLLPVLRPPRARVLGCDPDLTWRALPTRPLREPRYGDPLDLTARRQGGWARYGSAAERVLLGSALTAIAAAVVAAAVLRSDVQLLEHGVRTSGTVEGGGYGGRATQDYVDVRYNDAAGDVHEGTLHGPSPDELARGTAVTVVYDPKDPTRFRTTDDPNNGNLADDATAVLPTGSLVLLLLGAVTWFRWRRGTHVLGRGRWVDVEVAHLRGFPQRGSVLTALRGGPEGASLVARFRGSEGPVRELADPDGASHASLCVAPDRAYALLYREGLPWPVFVTLPRTPRQRDRWRRRLDRERLWETRGRRASAPVDDAQGPETDQRLVRTRSGGAGAQLDRSRPRLAGQLDGHRTAPRQDEPAVPPDVGVEQAVQQGLDVQGGAGLGAVLPQEARYGVGQEPALERLDAHAVLRGTAARSTARAPLRRAGRRSTAGTRRRSPPAAPGGPA